ncbi:MAG TPA: CBS domain-containing protein, partial [Syntrophomonadaceae bacterium]|nr:CBS domain-containing protein [Syntrophomonadaceae bacterium]
MITRAHVLRLIAQNIDLKAPAREIMKRDIITISPDTEVQKLITWNVSSLPVIDQDKLVGIVTLSDTIRAYYKSVVNIRNTL